MVSFKRRGVDDSDHQGDDAEVTRLLFAVDVSGSMYRFNGQDGRLERLLESTMMVSGTAGPGWQQGRGGLGVAGGGHFHSSILYA